MSIQYGQYIVPTADKLVNFGVGQPSNSELPLEIIKKSCLQLGDLTDNAVLQYGDIPGYKEFRKVLGSFLQKNYSQDVNIDNLFVTNGVTGALALISSLFISKCKRVYVEEPTYFLAINIFKEFGFEVETINLENDGINLDELSEKLDNNKDEVKLLYTIPTFHNPTSITMTHEKRKNLIELSKKHNMYIIADEVYQLLYFDKKPDLPLYYYGGNVFSLSSFSKILAPSLRLGWIQCNDELMNMLSGCGQLDSSGGINPFISRIVHNVIENGDLDTYIKNTRSTLKDRCDTLCNSLTGLKYNKPDGGYFIWIDTPFDSRKFLTYCEDKQIKFHTGNKFSGHGRLENCLRLSFSFYDADGLQIGGNRLSKAYSEYLDCHEKTQLYIYGARGRLGSKICASASKEYNVVELNRDLTNLSQVDNAVIIDITSVEGTNKLISVLLHQNINIPLIIGTTGQFNEGCITNIMDYSKNNPVFKVSNFSYGIPEIEKILKTININNWNVSIKETHHINKLDKPSGTAKSLAKIINHDTSNIESIRESDIFGRHEITFDSEHEQIKIIHEAKDRDIFAEGCFRFIKLIREKENGFYDSNFSKNKEFTRYSACGNTFIITDFYPKDKNFIIDKCKEFCVDGFIWYTVEDNSEYDFEWKFWNNDGITANMCLNGSRAISYHVSNLEDTRWNNFWSKSNKLYFRSFSGINQTANIKNDIVEVTAPKYIDYKQINDTTYCVNVGVNHTIRYLNAIHENFDTFDLESFYKEMNKTYRSNVSIVMQCTHDTFKIRTFEKGVESETGACGTACIAAYYKQQNNTSEIYFIPSSSDKIRIVKDEENIYISSNVSKF